MILNIKCTVNIIQGNLCSSMMFVYFFFFYRIATHQNINANKSSVLQLGFPVVRQEVRRALTGNVNSWRANNG